MKTQGGSPWVRDMILVALYPRREAPIQDEVGDLELGIAEAALTEETLRAELAILAPTADEAVPELYREQPVETLVAVAEEVCPRWVHHRDGQRCMVCGA